MNLRLLIYAILVEGSDLELKGLGRLHVALVLDAVVHLRRETVGMHASYQLACMAISSSMYVYVQRKGPTRVRGWGGWATSGIQLWRE